MSRFNPNFDREKFAFLELANRGDGLTPIDNIGCKEGLFESITANTIKTGTIVIGQNISSAKISSDGKNFFTLPTSLNANSKVINCTLNDEVGIDLGAFLTCDDNGQISLSNVKIIVKGAV
jgi:hypothetical protein